MGNLREGSRKTQDAGSMTMDITHVHRKLAGKLLRLAYETFSNNVCNDFDLESHGFDPEERRVIYQMLRDFSDPEYSNNNNVAVDWMLMDALAELFDPQ